MIKINDLYLEDITPEMFVNFNHCQMITKVWVQSNQGWKLEETSSLREWNREKRVWITEYIRQQIERGGACVVAYDGNVIVGFGCLDGYLLGETGKYANLTMLFVDDKWKRKGIGKMLFKEITKRATAIKADKLFISAIPSLETVAFYFSMGCEDAKETISAYIDTEKDRYLEYSLVSQK